MDARNHEDKVDTTTAEEQRDAAWDELDAEEKKVEGTTEEGLSDPDPELDDDKQPLDTPSAPTDSELLKKEAEQHEESADAKALKDTKAWATKLAQENAELKRLMSEGATKQEIAEQRQTVEEAKKDIGADTLDSVYREYPELKEVLSPLLDTVKTLQAQADEMKRDKQVSAEQQAENDKKAALENFETKIMPKVMEGPDGHADFKEIISSADYFEWAEKQRPGVKTAALMSNDPEDIKWALSQYKKDRAIPEAAKMKEQEEAKRKQKLNNQMSLRGGASTISTGKGKADPTDYDAAWEQAEKEDRK